MNSYKSFLIEEAKRFHLDNNIPIYESIFRYGSGSYFALIENYRQNMNSMDLSQEEIEFLSTDIGSFGVYEGKEVPLDLPMLIEGKHLLNYKNWGFILPDGTIIDALTNKKYSTEKDHMALYARFKGIYIDIDSRFGDRYEAYTYPKSGKLKDINPETDKIEWDSDNFVDELYKRGNEHIRWYIDSKAQLWLDSSAPTKKMTENVLAFVYDNDMAMNYETVRWEFFPNGKLEKVLPDAELSRTAFINKLRLYLLDNIEEAKEPELNSPKRGGNKKFYVYVRNQRGNVIKVEFGDTTGLNAKINNPEARRSFAARHRCAEKKDKTTPGYWACRIPRYTKALGLTGGGEFFW